MNRRHFVELAAASSAALATGCITPLSSRWHLWQSTSSIHFKSLPLEQACERIAGLGFTDQSLA